MSAAQSSSAKPGQTDYKTIGAYAAGVLGVAAIAGGAYYLYSKHKANSKAASAATASADAGKASAAKSSGSMTPAPLPSAHHVSSHGADVVPLERGQLFPTLGFGTLCSVGDKPEQIAAAVRQALTTGFRHVDCASAYNNEKEIGEVLNEFVGAKAQGTAHAIKRKDLFVTSKLWGNAWSDVRTACQTTLKNLQLDYLDLYLVHWPFENCPPSAEVKSGAKPAPAHIGYSAERYLAVWRQMEALVDEGLVKNIGVSNLTTAKLKALLKDARIKPAVNQVEAHPYLAQPTLLQYCKSNGIIVSSYFVIGSARRAQFMRADSDPVLLEDKTVVAVANECKATPAQVLIAWALQRGTVPIVKALDPKRIRENWDAYGVSLTAAQMKRIDALDRDFRYLKADIFAWPVTTPWRDLWDNEHVLKPDN